jgi:NADH-quinone oxidoreductase subunit J
MTPLLALYLLFAFGAVAGGLNVVARRNPVNSAIALLFTFICVAALYILHGAPMLAMIQIIVYAGAILILVVFTIMLLALREPGPGLTRFWSFPQKIAALLACTLLGGELLYLAWRAVAAAPPGAAVVKGLGDPATLGHAIFEHYLLPFEATGVLLLAAILGAVSLTRRPKGAPQMAGAAHGDETDAKGERP